MKSTVELDIDLPRQQLAALFADPTLNTKWMDDIERYEPVSGQPGAPGSKYRLIPKKGDMVFVATVISNDLPRNRAYSSMDPTSPSPLRHSTSRCLLESHASFPRRCSPSRT